MIRLLPTLKHNLKRKNLKTALTFRWRKPLQFKTSIKNKGHRTFPKLSVLPAIFAALIVSVVWYFAEQQSRDLYLESQRDGVSKQLDDVRSRLEIHLDSDLYLAQGLAAALSVEPNMSQERFTNLATQVFKESKNLRNVAAAPDLVVKLIYPTEGNEPTLGLEYREIPNQYQDILKAQETGRMVLAGPLTLVQGGRAFIGRYPIYDTTVSGAPFWGILAAVIDLDRLYSSSGLYNPYSKIGITLERIEEASDQKTLFFGAEITAQNDPVSQTVRLPTGEWTISATPIAGWKHEAPNRVYLRIGFLIAAGLIVIPLIGSAILIHQRHEYIDVLSRQKEDLHRQSRRLHLAMEAAGAGVWEYDIDKNVVHWDAQMNEIYGFPTSTHERFIADWANRIHPEDRARAQEEFENGVTKRTHFSSVFRIILPNGDLRHIRSLANVSHFTGSNKIVGVNWDVTEETQLQSSIEAANLDLIQKNNQIEAAHKRVEFHAYHDALTELPNRRYLDRLLTRHSRNYAAGLSNAAVLQIDLDEFKNVNDTLGHFAGDQVLVQVAQILRNFIDKEDSVIRLGGDEFVVFIDRSEKEFFTEGGNLQSLAEGIIEALAVPLQLAHGTTRVSASIGMSTDAICTTTPSNLLRDADVALYEAKLSGRNQYKLCDPDLRRTLDNKNQFLTELETALREGQIVPAYQPQYSGKDMSIFGAEALARWDHPTRGLLTPKDFLEDAKEIGKDADIDRAILKRVLEDREAWQKQGIEIPKISINVSAKQISTPAILDDLALLNIPRGALCFELLESIFMDDDNQVLQDNVKGIKAMGIEIEIDDFGTGFASVVALQKLSPKRMKIDNQLVSPIIISPNARKILGSLIEIGKALEIEIIAEGVESAEHVDALVALGCDALQGYALCRPLSGEAFIDLIQNRTLPPLDAVSR